MSLRYNGYAVLALLFVGSGCANPGPPWVPGVSYPTPQGPVYRGLLDRRGLIHAHNVHSHDACVDDGASADTASPQAALSLASNQSCFNEFRGDLCKAQHDFVFLSDHGSMFDATDFPDQAGITANAANPLFLEGDNTMLYAQTSAPSFMGKPDQLVVRNGSPVANLVTCQNEHTTLLMPGSEGTNLMPVGLEAHVASRSYGVNTESSSPIVPADVNASIAADKANGAVVLMAHPEDMTEDEFVTFPIDGFEMYNLHANALLYPPGFTQVLNMIAALQEGDTSQIPQNPNLILLGFFMEDPRYLSRWAYALSNGVRRVTTLGSDCHQNAIPVMLSDGEWGDRYRRVMEWFSNHLLVIPNADGSWNDVNLKEALRAGRLYGAFEVLGYPVGFDYHASLASTVAEMGDVVALLAEAGASVKLPTVQNLDPAATPPKFTVRILLADGENWDEVATGPGISKFAPTKPGAYRAEIREVPYHLAQQLGPVATRYLSHDYVWIYSNAIYVR